MDVSPESTTADSWWPTALCISVRTAADKDMFTDKQGKVFKASSPKACFWALGNLNWVGKEMGFSAGVGVVIRQGLTGNITVVERMKAVFERDWHSHYSKALDPDQIPVCSTHTLKDNTSVWNTHTINSSMHIGCFFCTLSSNSIQQSKAFMLSDHVVFAHSLHRC